MAVPSSGELELRGDIALEVYGSATGTNISLRAMSDLAGFSAPDAMTDFYGYSSSVAPSATTNSMTSVGETSMTLNGNITSDGGATITERGFYFGTNSASPLNNTKYTVGGTTGAYSLGVGGLSSGTGYYCWAFATNAKGTTYGSRVYAATVAAFVPVYAASSGQPYNRLSLNADINTGFGYYRGLTYLQYLNPNTGSYINRYFFSKIMDSQTGGSVTLESNIITGLQQYAINTPNRWVQVYDQWTGPHTCEGAINCRAASGRNFSNQSYTSSVSNGNGYLYEGYNSGTGTKTNIYISPTTFGNYFTWSSGNVAMTFSYT